MFFGWWLDMWLHVEISGKNVLVIIVMVDIDLVIKDFVKLVFGYVG